MKLIHFLNEFPDEESCELSIKSYREKSGIYCKKCKKVTHHYWFSGQSFSSVDIAGEEGHSKVVQ
jgi:hypothetical protein